MNGISPALFQAARGPIMLVTFGVLVAIDHSGYGLSFWRTWPFLFIVYGVLKLIERLLPRPAYVPPPPQAPPPAATPQGRVS
jgi:hypothetical protein